MGADRRGSSAPESRTGLAAALSRCSPLFARSLAGVAGDAERDEVGGVVSVALAASNHVMRGENSNHVMRGEIVRGAAFAARTVADDDEIGEPTPRGLLIGARAPARRAPRAGRVDETDPTSRGLPHPRDGRAQAAGDPLRRRPAREHHAVTRHVRAGVRRAAALPRARPAAQAVHDRRRAQHHQDAPAARVR